MRRRDTGLKRGMMCRCGIICVLPAETNGILSANPYSSVDSIRFLFAAIR